MFRFKLAIIILLLFSVNYLLFGQINEQQLINSVEKYRAENKLPQAAGLLNKLAFYYWENTKHQKALQSFEQSVALNKEIGNSNAIKAIYSNMGMIYSDMGQPETSLVFFRKSLLISRSQKNKRDISTNLINISVVLSSLNRPEESLEHLKEALEISSELNNKEMLRTCYGMLVDVYKDLGESEKSMEYFTIYTSFQKQIQKEEIDKQNKQTKEKIAKVEKKAQKAIKDKKQVEKKLVVTQDSLKEAEVINKFNQLKIQKQKVEIKNQRLLTLIFIIAMVFVVIVALFILRSYRLKKKHNAVLEHRNEEIRKQNVEIKAKNKKINQSINYAKNIQGALLPEIDSFKSLFPESFVFFEPRDVVSGDFYWYTQINNKQSKLKVVSAVDCTGHGVPGAFMSMLGMSFMEEIILDKGIVSPEKILENMHKMVRASLKQENTGNTDGMDMTICVYDELRKIIKFAGAVNPLVYIQNGEMNIIKGDIFGIGGQMKIAKGNEMMFQQQTLDVSIPTTCYMFSDGFADQFGGENGRKYFMKTFKELLFKIHEKPMHEQKEILKNKLAEWQGNDYKRVDDVLIIGFKV